MIEGTAGIASLSPSELRPRKRMRAEFESSTPSEKPTLVPLEVAKALDTWAETNVAIHRVAASKKRGTSRAQFTGLPLAQELKKAAYTVNSYAEDLARENTVPQAFARGTLHVAAAEKTKSNSKRLVHLRRGVSLIDSSFGQDLPPKMRLGAAQNIADANFELAMLLRKHNPNSAPKQAELAHEKYQAYIGKNGQEFLRELGAGKPILDCTSYVKDMARAYHRSAILSAALDNEEHQANELTQAQVLQASIAKDHRTALEKSGLPFKHPQNANLCREIGDANFNLIALNAGNPQRQLEHAQLASRWGSPALQKHLAAYETAYRRHRKALAESALPISHAQNASTCADLADAAFHLMTHTTDPQREAYRAIAFRHASRGQLDILEQTKPEGFELPEGYFGSKNTTGG